MLNVFLFLLIFPAKAQIIPDTAVQALTCTLSSPESCWIVSFWKLLGRTALARWDFATRQGTKIFDGTKQIRFVSWNIPGLILTI